MLRVGLTGGIGSGKSTVAERLRSLGAVVVDADRVAREVVAPGTPGLAAVADRFGLSVLSDDGSLDRGALGALVFGDRAALADLEALTHPLVAARSAELIGAAPPDAIVVHDVPLLVEKSMGAAYHLVVVVGADERARVARLTGSRAMTEADAVARIRAQTGDAERRAAADVWLDNDGDLSALDRQVASLWRDRLVGFETNLQTGGASRRPETPTLVDCDASWPAAADRLMARILRVLGPSVVVEHIGSTAVPGLLAKDVIDLQVGVSRLDEADSPQFMGALARQGFPRLVAVVTDTALPGSEGRDWSKRFHLSADPGRVAHVHVREVGGSGWRFALLFRDWLRADADARGEYAALKRRLADGSATTTDYTAAKEPWFGQVAGRAETWARDTGWARGEHARD